MSKVEFFVKKILVEWEAWILHRKEGILGRERNVYPWVWRVCWNEKGRDGTRPLGYRGMKGF